jgi:hypothetical protein
LGEDLMKAIFLIFSFTTFISCNEVDFKVGDCMQKPDESVVWKITEINAGIATTIRSGKNMPEDVREVQLNNSWMKLRCR